MAIYKIKIIQIQEKFRKANSHLIVATTVEIPFNYLKLKDLESLRTRGPFKLGLVPFFIHIIIFIYVKFTYM